MNDSDTHAKVGFFKASLVFGGSVLLTSGSGFLLTAFLFRGWEFGILGAVTGFLLGLLIGMFMLAAIKKSEAPGIALASVGVMVLLGFLACLYGITSTCAICGAPATTTETYYKNDPAHPRIIPDGQAEIRFCDNCARPGRLPGHKAFGSILRHIMVVATVGMTLLSIAGYATSGTRRTRILISCACWSLITILYFGFWSKWSLDTLFMSMH